MTNKKAMTMTNERAMTMTNEKVRTKAKAMGGGSSETVARGDGLFGDAEEYGHLVVEEAFAGFVGLDPLAVDDELGDGALAYMGDYFFGCAGGVFDVDLFVGDVVSGEEALGFTAVAAPGGGVEGEVHRALF
jgi:hypothetical protein